MATENPEVKDPGPSNVDWRGPEVLGDTEEQRVLVLDTETIGLPMVSGFREYPSYKDTRAYDSARLVQVGLEMHRRNLAGDFILEDRVSVIIKPDGYEIKNSEFHNVTQNRAVSEGMSVKDAAAVLLHYFENAGLIVAHNAAFDINIISSELYRYELSSLLGVIQKIPFFCTCEGSRELMKIPFRGGYKHPSLKEFYQYATGNPPSEADKLHQADYDCKILSEAFFALVKKGVFEVTPTAAHEADAPPTGNGPPTEEDQKEEVDEDASCPPLIE